MSVKKLWLGYAIILVMTVWIAYWRGEKGQELVTLPKSVRTLDASPFERWTRRFELNATMAKQVMREWGIVIPKRSRNKAPVSSKKNKEASENRIEILRKGRTICRGKTQCYRLLGFFSREGRGYASFYAKGRKPSILGVEINESLPGMPDLYLREAEPGRVVVAERNGTRAWIFGFFDVNQSKYRPKEINVSDIQ